MPRNFTSITAEDAKAVLDEMGGNNIQALGRELKRRGTPVTVKTLYIWKKKKWINDRKMAHPRNSFAAIGEVERSAAKLGLSAEQIAEISKNLNEMDDPSLLLKTMHNMMVMTNVMMFEMQAQAKSLLRTDARGVSAVMMACRHLAEASQEMMRESVRLAQISKGIEDTTVEREKLPAPIGYTDSFSDMAGYFGNEVSRMPDNHKTHAHISVNGGRDGAN